MDMRCGPMANFALVMLLGQVCFGTEVLQFQDLNDSSSRLLGKTRFVPEPLIEFGQESRQGLRLQAPEEVDEDSTESEIDGLPDFGAETFNLKLLSQQKMIESGDGTESLNAKPTESGTGTSPGRPKTLKRRVLVFKASWCGACQALNYEWPKLEAVRWKIGRDDTHHFQVVDADERPDLLSKYGVSSLPTILVVENEQEISRHGLLGAFDLAELYYGRLK